MYQLILQLSDFLKLYIASAPAISPEVAFIQVDILNHTSVFLKLIIRTALHCNVVVPYEFGWSVESNCIIPITSALMEVLGLVLTLLTTLLSLESTLFSM